MKATIYSLLFVSIAIISCTRQQASGTATNEDSEVDSSYNTNNPDHVSIEQYRDTLIGKFNGIDIDDTLIAEPIGEI